jgi:hypothetical protein
MLWPLIQPQPVLLLVNSDDGDLILGRPESRAYELGMLACWTVDLNLAYHFMKLQTNAANAKDWTGLSRGWN